MEREKKGLKAQQVSEEEIQKRVDEATDKYMGKSQEQQSEISKLKKFVASIVAKGNQFLGEEAPQMVQEENSNISSNYDLWLDKFTGGKKQTLELLIKHKKLTRSQLGIMIGLKQNNIIKNILPALKSAGLISYDKEKVELIA